MRNILYDEKMAGTIHLAVGASYPKVGGTNVSVAPLGPDQGPPRGRPDRAGRRGRPGERHLADLAPFGTVRQGVVPRCSTGPDERVALATCAEIPTATRTFRPLIAALAAEGVESEAAVWDDPAVGLVAVTTSSSRARPGTTPSGATTFLAWAASLPRVLNPLDVLEWNTDKQRYLTDLAAAGVPVVPTDVRRARRGARAAGRAVRGQAGDLGRRPELGAVRARTTPTPPRRSSPASTPRAARRWSSRSSATTRRRRSSTSTARTRTPSGAACRSPRRATGRSSTWTRSSARPRRRRQEQRDRRGGAGLRPTRAALRPRRPDGRRSSSSSRSPSPRSTSDSGEGAADRFATRLRGASGGRCGAGSTGSLTVRRR